MRLAELSYEQLSPEQKVVWDEVVAGPRKKMHGPFFIWLHSPELLSRGEKLGLYARFQSSLPQRLSELCILIMASHWTASGEWIDHEPIARGLGVDAEALENLRKGLPASFKQADEAATYQFARELLTTHEVSDDSVCGSTPHPNPLPAKSGERERWHRAKRHPCRLPQAEVAGDDLALDLAGALAEREQPRVTPVALHRAFADVAGAGEDLHAVRGDELQGLGGGELRHRRHQAEVLAGVDPPRQLGDQELRLGDLQRHVGEPGGDSPEQHAAWIRSEVVRWAELVKKAGLDKTQ